MKEPLMHIVKRDDATLLRGLVVRLAALLLSLLVCAVVIYGLTGMNPLSVYAGLWDGAVGTSRRLWITLRDTAVLLCIGFAVMPAFRMRFWNVGAEGQVLMGAMATAAVMIYGANLPAWLLYTLCPLAGVAAGVLWGVIPAFFKAHWNTNETLFTLMMNYIATQAVSFGIVYWENPSGSNHVGLINNDTKAGWLPSVGGNKYLLTCLIVLALALILYVYMRYSKQGYEIAVVGESENTAHYAGINVKKVILRTMAICGGLGGVAGYLLCADVGHTISTGLAGGRGFTAIVVAWLGKLNPFSMMLVSFLLVFMQKGSSQLATQFGLNENASDILTGIILFFILGCEFFINYRVELRRHEKEAAKA
ncbi:MAG: ABC transporter permease [Clostridiales bacterium]|nr:ABC transporter permease [Clostridiales bacterium]